jgi:hypothetical protein
MSPSISTRFSGGDEIAFQSVTGHLFTFSAKSGVPVDTGLGMAAGTSPSISE